MPNPRQNKSPELPNFDSPKQEFSSDFKKFPIEPFQKALELRQGTNITTPPTANDVLANEQSEAEKIGYMLAIAEYVRPVWIEQAKQKYLQQFKEVEEQVIKPVQESSTDEFSLLTERITNLAFDHFPDFPQIVGSNQHYLPES